ncbi:MAG: 3-oxoacyl-ACP reductase FabG [Clostridium sp.]|nr:3-oxoacyl-ACP reductase FabG [Clostridium sp.]
MNRFKDKVILVTGGSRGIGAEIVRKFCEEGGEVYFVYAKSDELASELEKELQGQGYKCKSFKCDVSSEDECEVVVEKIKAITPKIDILVNNAGIIKDGIMLLQSSEEWKKVIDTNLIGLYNMTKKVAFEMIKNRSGVIVNMSSIAAFNGVLGQTNYCAAKAAIVAMTKSLVKEIGSKNIRINVVAPGYIDTDMTRDIKKLESMKKLIPQRRFGKASEVASVVLFLASDEASYVNGQTLIVDGGFSA